MTFPISESRTAAQTTNSTSWTLTGLVPAHSSGDVLLLAIGVDGVPTLTPDPVGGVAWTNITDTGNAANKLAVWWLRATSAQGADADLVVGSSATEQGVARCWRLQGAHATTAPAAGTAATGSSTAPNPPLLNPAGWDVEDTWWLALVNTDAAVTATVFPANMDTATGFTDVSGGGNGAGLHTCRLESAIASLDPGTFTLSATETWVAQTVAIRPAPPVPPTGTLAVTQQNQTLAASGTAPTVGEARVTWAELETPAASGTSGTLAATQAADTLAASGTVTQPPNTGTLAVTQASDTIAAAGQLGASGSLSATQAGQTLAASGTVSGPAVTYVRVSQIYLQAPEGAEPSGTTGTLAQTQANQTLAASGTSTPPTVTGALAVTQDTQTLAASGAIAPPVTGRLGGRVFQANVFQTNVFQGAIVNQTSQTLAAAGTVTSLGFVGSLAETQDPQTLTAAGVLRYTGTLAATQAHQTLTASGTSTPPGVSGSLTRTQADQTLAASGTVTSLGIAGSLSVTQANQTLAAAGVLRYTGTLSQTQAAQTLAAAGWIRVTGTLAVTQAAQTLAAAGGTAQNIGALAVTQAVQTLAASGVLRYTGVLSATQANQTLAAAGVQRYTGTLAAFQAPNTLAASGVVTVIGIAGNLAVTQQNQTLAGVGVLPGYIAFGVNTLGGATSPNGRGSTTPGKDARGGTLVAVDYR